MKVEDRIIIAVDANEIEKAKKIIEQTKSMINFYKVGSQLFTACGPRSIELVKRYDGKVFLDLKFHDIPTTVAKAVESAMEMGVDMMNLHTSGGVEMMQAAAAAAQEKAKKLSQPKPLILGVTVLTSISNETLKSDLACFRSLNDQVLYLAALAKKAGLDGVIASPNEISLIRKNLGDDFIILTPGIRPSWYEKGDHKRTMTPSEAIKAGADYIVIGRPVTASENPAQALQKILNEIKSTNCDKKSSHPVK